MQYNSVFKADLFADQTIIVTGGGSGIGRCIAHELAHLGASVVITGRSLEKLTNVVAEIVEDGGKADCFAFDIRHEDGVALNVGNILDKAWRGERLGQQCRRTNPRAAGGHQPKGLGNRCPDKSDRWFP